MEFIRQRLKIALMSYAMDDRSAKGSALYTRKLIEELLKDNTLDIYLIHYDKVDDPLYKEANEIIMPRVKLPYGSRFISQLLFFWKYRKNKFDVIHWFQPRVYPFYWLAPAKKIVVTIHGAGDVSAPSKFIFSRLVFNFVLIHFHKWIDMAIADCEDAKQEVVKYYGFSEDRVKSIYLGGGENYKFIEKNEARSIAEKYGINKPYILDVSRLQPHKNIIRLIKAYELLRKNNQEIKEKLVIVGGPTSSIVEEYEIAKRSQFSSDIMFVDYVDTEDLNAIYSGSELFVFPSLSEGFGLPVLEAMASGVPVITSNTTSLPEIGGDAVIAIDPLDVNDISSAMKRVLSDKELARKMIDSGLRRAAEFTWKKTADQTKELYIKLLEK